MEVDWSNSKVQAALEKLALKGFDAEEIKQYSKDIVMSCIVPSAPAEAATLLHAAEIHAIKKEQDRKEDQRAAIIRRFMPFVGRVLCLFDAARTTGSCVLIGPAGLSVTARHNVYEEKDEKVKRRGKHKLVSPDTIVVTYPNALHGHLEFSAMIRHENVGEDLIILAPIHQLNREPDYFASWSMGERQVSQQMCMDVILISYPDLMDKEFPGRKVQDMPTCDLGSVGLVTQRRCISTYRSFSGSSGGLVLKVDAEDGLHGIGIHLSMAHHTDLLKSWSEKELSILNLNLGRKGYYGVATRIIGSYLESFFNKHHKDLAGAQLQRAARILERPSRSGIVAVRDFANEVIDDSLLLDEDAYKENTTAGKNETFESRNNEKRISGKLEFEKPKLDDQPKLRKRSSRAEFCRKSGKLEFEKPKLDDKPKLRKRSRRT